MEQGGEFFPPQIRKGPNVADVNRAAVLRSVVEVGGVSTDTLKRHRLWDPPGNTFRRNLELLCGNKGSPLIKVREGVSILAYRVNENSSEVKRIQRESDHKNRRGAVNGQDGEQDASNGSTPLPGVVSPRQATQRPTQTAPVPSAVTRLATLEHSVDAMRDEFTARISEIGAALTSLGAKFDQQAPTQPVLEAPSPEPVRDFESILPTVSAEPSSAGETVGEPTIVVVDGDNLQNMATFKDLASGVVFHMGIRNREHVFLPVDGTSRFGSNSVRILSKVSPNIKGREAFDIEVGGVRETITCIKFRPCEFGRVDWKKFRGALDTLGGVRHDVRRIFYFASVHPSYFDGLAQEKREASNCGITVRIDSESSRRRSSDMYIGAGLVGEVMLYVAQAQRKGEDLPSRMTLVLVSGDGAAAYGVALVRLLMKECYGITLTVRVVSWKESLAKASRLGFSLVQEADDVHYVDDMDLN